MDKLIFLTEYAIEGGYHTKAIGHSIFTQTSNLNKLNRNIIKAIEYHFDEQASRQFILKL